MNNNTFKCVNNIPQTPLRQQQRRLNFKQLGCAIIIILNNSCLKVVQNLKQQLLDI